MTNFEIIVETLPALIIGGIGIGVTILYNKRTSALAHHKMQKELFTEFNLRYDKLNGELYRIAVKYEGKGYDELQLEDRKIILDYFNLCAEEKFWFTKKRLDPQIYYSWEAGMKYWFSIPVIAEAWQAETKDRSGRISYYLGEKEDLL